MRNLLQTIGLVTIFITFPGCGQGPKVHANSDKQMYRSVATTMSRMSINNRIQFEVAFWSLHNSAKDKNKFREEINGKTPAEVVQMASADFNARKAAGEEGYSKYESWEDLIEKLKQERASYDEAHDKREPRKKRDSANQILGVE